MTYSIGVVTGSHIVTSAEATATTLNIDTSLEGAAMAIVQIVRSGGIVGADAKPSLAAGVLTVANGTTYSLTANDVINWLVA